MGRIIVEVRILCTREAIFEKQESLPSGKLTLTVQVTSVSFNLNTVKHIE